MTPPDDDQVTRGSGREEQEMSLRALIAAWHERARKMRDSSRDTVVESLIAQYADATKRCADELEELLNVHPTAEGQHGMVNQRVRFTTDAERDTYERGYNNGYRAGLRHSPSAPLSYTRRYWRCPECRRTGFVLLRSDDTVMKAAWRRLQSHNAQVTEKHNRCNGLSVKWAEGQHGEA